MILGNWLGLWLLASAWGVLLLLWFLVPKLATYELDFEHRITMFGLKRKVLWSVVIAKRSGRSVTSTGVPFETYLTALGIRTKP